VNATSAGKANERVATAGDGSVTDGSGGSDTSDPPPLGSTGSTDDPPATGGTGTTGDPPGGGTTNDPGLGGTGDPGTGGATADPPDECIPEEMLNINVIVFGDASPSGADVEGSMYVGGTATFTGGYSVGTAEATDCTSYDLVVGGSLVGSPVVKNGSVYVNDVAYSGSADSPCGVFTPPTASPVDFADLEKELVGISLALAAYPANGSVVEGATLRFTGDDPVLNVFNVTTAQLQTASKISIETPPESTVIVNVSGTTLTWNGVGFRLPDGGAACKGGTTTLCSQIVWNMPEVTELTLGGVGVQGSIFAPYATFTGDGGNVDGQVIVRHLLGGIEFHPYFFTGCLELPI
jgi:choice-of-anchor A domain-containing protein